MRSAAPADFQQRAAAASAALREAQRSRAASLRTPSLASQSAGSWRAPVPPLASLTPLVQGQPFTVSWACLPSRARSSLEAAGWKSLEEIRNADPREFKRLVAASP
eukprot:313659-Pyramimonas_sp.AAC.1